MEGRYWLQLEWRALAAALGATGRARDAAIRDALAFRSRRRAVAGAAEAERALEINERLPQYTATVVVNETPKEAAAHAIEQLEAAPRQETLVRTFPYPSGAAYDVLLDAYAPGWTRRIRSTDDLGAMLAAAADLSPAADVENAALRYGGPELLAAEERRDEERQTRIAELRRRLVDGPCSCFLTGGRTRSSRPA